MNGHVDYMAESTMKLFYSSKLIRRELASIKRMTERERQFIYKHCANDNGAFQEFSGLGLTPWQEKVVSNEARLNDAYPWAKITVGKNR